MSAERLAEAVQALPVEFRWDQGDARERALAKFRAEWMWAAGLFPPPPDPRSAVIICGV